MPRSLRDSIRQARPFDTPGQEAALSILRTAAELAASLDQVFKPFGVTATQYNALRILRGAGPAGLCRHEVIDRMVTRMPDVTRLLDRLEEAGLVSRARDDADRRLVNTRLTEAGAAMLERLDPLVAEEHRRRMAGLSEPELRQVIELLAKLRDGQPTGDTA